MLKNFGEEFQRRDCENSEPPRRAFVELNKSAESRHSAWRASRISLNLTFTWTAKLFDPFPLNEWGNRTDMSHWAHSAGPAVEWQLDVIDIYPWISTESGSIVTRPAIQFFPAKCGHAIGKIDSHPTWKINYPFSPIPAHCTYSGFSCRCSTRSAANG